MLGLPGRQVSPAAVDAALARDIALLLQGLQNLAADTAALRDPATRRAVIAELGLPDSDEPDDEVPDAFELMLMGRPGCRGPCGARAPAAQAAALTSPAPRASGVLQAPIRGASIPAEPADCPCRRHAVLPPANGPGPAV